MPDAPRDVRLFISDILEAIGKIDRFTGNMSYEEFLKDERTQDAVLRNLEIIGEAVKNIPTEVKDRYPDIDWKGASGMRDKLIHEYFGVSLYIVWETIKNDLPPLKQKMSSISK